MHDRGCVAGGANVLHCVCDAAGAIGGAAARCRSPGGGSSDSMHPPALSIPTTRRAASIATYSSVSPTSTALRASTTTQKATASPLHAHVVQNTNGLVRRDQLGHRTVPPRVQGDVRAFHEGAKQALHALSDRLLKAVERRLLLGGRLGVRRDQESETGVNPVNKVERDVVGVR